MDATQLQQVLDAVFARFAGNAAPANTASSSLAHATLASSLDNRITKFHYDSECGNTFDRWFKRFGVLIEEDGKELPEQTKVRLLLGKLGDDEYNKYRDSISPTQPDQVKWGESLTKLKDLFVETRSLFVRRFECFQIRQKPSQDITSLVAHINAACENADLSLTKEQLKCIILVIALRDEHHDLRQKCLKMLEEAQKNGTQITLKQIENMEKTSVTWSHAQLIHTQLIQTQFFHIQLIHISNSSTTRHGSSSWHFLCMDNRYDVLGLSRSLEVINSKIVPRISRFFRL